ncbi:hypothetical protein L9F63_015374 [Diploptera punctata]|uniref:Uncharacterized protein n=1 Tax=Diploptera punctata TaxID=6984 RepID=A0AAD8A695_DIPPU|nr:hypothetical protein L9F63_015374 [Diploptera punctata]
MEEVVVDDKEIEEAWRVGCSALIPEKSKERPGYGHNMDEQLEKEYHEARQIGEEGYDCRVAYPSCPKGHGLFDLISALENDVL